MEAMRKLDAKLVAYLAGENMLPKQSEPELELELKADEEELSLEAEAEALLQDTVDETVKLTIREEKLQLFKRINGIKLQLEALTLEAEGTKRMELLQNEIRPIFTVECQLSHELIKDVPRYEMFHIMQFESEKFHSLTQCTRFGQEAQRAVNLALNDVVDCGSGGAAAAAIPAPIPNFGRIHFVVWWREPGTCLNELLGMGVLELKQLYDASLLEQCKRITIQRRGVQLANLYLKINLQLPPTANNNSNSNNNVTNTLDCSHVQQLNELLSDNNNNHNNNSSSNNNIDDDEESITKRQPQRNENALNNGKPLSTATTAAAAPVTDANIGATAVATNAVPPENNNTGGSGSGSGSGDGNFQLESSGNFTAETSKIRLLKGLIYVNETRNLEMNANCEYFLVCRRFWHEEPAVLVAGGEQKFNYQEKFGVINDEQFLSRVERQQLQLEIWQRVRTAAAVETGEVDKNGNSGNSNSNANTNTRSLLQPVGVIQLPLHQFFIAYKDEAMTNRLCRGKLPVISIDAWAPIIECDETHNCAANVGTAIVGELKCMLAIGSEEQITNLRATRGLPTQTSDDQIIAAVTDVDLIAFKRLDVAAARGDGGGGEKSSQSASNAAIDSSVNSNANADLRKTADLFDMLQRALASPSPTVRPTQTPVATTATATALAAAASSTSSNAASTTPLKPLQHKSFKFELAIMRANGLPLNPAAKGKSAKSAKRQANALTSKRFPPGESPSTYVTFQADDCQGSRQHRSHEGGVYATGIVERSIQPQWQQHFRVTTSVDYLKNPQQRFILKLWKKAACVGTACASGSSARLQPTPLEDVIIGFAALDLSAFARGLRISGWFNVVDFNGRINGQLELRAQPLEDVHKLLNISPLAPPQQLQPPAVAATANPASVDAVIDQFENSLDLTHLNLGQAIKRKFTELEEISQRLRTRLADVTGEHLAPQFNIDVLDDWRPLDGNECDDELAEFERDINTETPSTSAAAQLVQAVQQAAAVAITTDDNKVISLEEKTAERGPAAD